MTLNAEKILSTLCVLFTPKLGKVLGRRLLEQVGWQDLLNPNLLQRTIPGIPFALLQALQSLNVRKRAHEEFEWLEKNQITLRCILDEDYPSLLKEISDAPPLLFIRGQKQDWQGLTPIAFVGTRQPSAYGLEVAEHLVKGLAGLPVILISGFARGIDGAIHRLALKHNIATVGVLGTGVDYIYPKQNEALFYEMLEAGCFVSEYPSRTEPHFGHFPERNRIISGLSEGVVLIEAPEKSGSLITATCALEQGREVMAVPGSIFSDKNRGSHALIGQGAKPIQSAQDILEGLGLSVQSVSTQIQPQPSLKLAEIEQKLFEILSHQPLHIDKISELSKLAAPSVASTLTTLTLKGIIEELPGKYFVRN